MSSTSTASNSLDYLQYGTGKHEHSVYLPISNLLTIKIVFSTVDNPILWVLVVVAVLLTVAFFIILCSCCKPRPRTPPLVIHHSDLAPYPRASVQNANAVYMEPPPPAPQPAQYYSPPAQVPEYRERSLSPPRPPHHQRVNSTDYYDNYDYGDVNPYRKPRFYDNDIQPRNAQDDLRRPPEKVYDRFMNDDRVTYHGRNYDKYKKRRRDRY